MKRVLQVLGALTHGGAETMIMNVYRNIDRTKIQFDFLVREHIDNGYENEILKMGGRIFVVESPKKIGLFKSLKKQIKIMKSNHYCAIHCHMDAASFISLIAAKKAKIPIRISHSHSTQYSGSKLKVFIEKKLIYLNATNLVACGEEAGKSLFNNKKFEVIYNGIDLNKFCKVTNDEKYQLRHEMNINENKLILINIGRFEEVKNHIFLLELVKRLNNINYNFELHLIGDGSLLKSIKDIVKKENIYNIIFHDPCDIVDKYLKMSDIFLLPSLYEGLPMTLVEAQSVGLKCISSDNVSKEVDCKMNLIDFIELDLKKWVEKITNYVAKNCGYDKTKLSKFDIKITAKKVLNLYNIKD